MNIQALLFDKDGTLFHFERSWANWARLAIERLADRSGTSMSQIADAMGFDLARHAFRPDSIVIAGSPADLVEALSPISNISPDEMERFLNQTATETELIETTPLVPLLEQLLARGLRLGVATNDAEAPAIAHLRASKIDTCFEFVSGYDSGFGVKPDPGPCLAFAQQCGIAPESIAMIGDSLHDLRAGRAAGMVTIGVLTGPADAGELAPHADVVLKDISDLPAWLPG